MSQSRLYTLKTDKFGKSILSFDLGLGIIDENSQQIVININGREYALQKPMWLNTMKVWDDGKAFFIVCNKRVDQNFAFQVLLKYALEKVEATEKNLAERITKVQQMKTRLHKELAA